jgi:hypothetical protein
MNRAFLLRVLVVVAVSVALAGMPKSSFAQRGSFHGGGGGFHGGGGGSGFHSGGFGGSHRGGGFSGFRGGRSFGGFNGFRGDRGFGGFGGFRDGRGFGGFRGDRFFRGFRDRDFFFDFDDFNFGFGFWPYWGAYPYWYGYGPWWGPYAYYSPYDYPYYPYDAPYYRYPRDDRDNRCRPDYRHPDNGCNDASPDNSRPNSENPPAKPSNTLDPESSPDRNYVTTNSVDDYRHGASNSNDSNDGIAATTPVAGNYQPANSTSQQLPSTLRPAVRNAIQALRAMPPDARERQLNSGRYDTFSSEEREFLSNASQPPQPEQSPQAE